MWLGNGGAVRMPLSVHPRNPSSLPGPEKMHSQPDLRLPSPCACACLCEEDTMLWDASLAREATHMADIWGRPAQRGLDFSFAHTAEVMTHK